MRLLVLNGGSSSLKYTLFNQQKVVVEGSIEQIGEVGGVADYHTALLEVERRLIDHGAIQSFEMLDAVAHRVVHGGERFIEPVIIDDEVVEAIRELIPLAPLHNRANLEGIERMRKLIPNTPQVAIFDTAFHHAMPPSAYLYAIPMHLYKEYGIRRYGFHGTSHAYVAKEAAKILKRPLESLHLITLHLGNGASICAIEGGKSIETSMGFTPLEGLVMGTRCGDIDPGIVLFLEKEGLDVDTILNKESGLKGICDHNDMRQVEEMALEGDEKAQLAIKIFVHRIKKYIGAYMALLGRVDGLIFTAGIGEHSTLIRAEICHGLEAMGIVIDAKRNELHQTIISSEESAVKVLVIKTDEAREIARQAEALLSVGKL